MRWGGEKEKKNQPNPEPILFKGKKQTASDVCCPSEKAGNAGLKDA